LDWLAVMSTKQRRPVKPVLAAPTVGIANQMAAQATAAAAAVESNIFSTGSLLILCCFYLTKGEICVIIIL